VSATSAAEGVALPGVASAKRRTPPVARSGPCARSCEKKEVGGGSVGLYTILLWPILYGVCHEKGGLVGGGHIAQWSCNSIAIE